MLLVKSDLKCGKSSYFLYSLIQTIGNEQNWYTWSLFNNKDPIIKLLSLQDWVHVMKKDVQVIFAISEIKIDLIILAILYKVELPHHISTCVFCICSAFSKSLDRSTKPKKALQKVQQSAENACKNGRFKCSYNLQWLHSFELKE